MIFNFGNLFEKSISVKQNPKIAPIKIPVLTFIGMHFVGVGKKYNKSKLELILKGFEVDYI